MTCNCVNTFNEKLKGYNTRLSQGMMLGECSNDGLMLETEQIETGRGKPKAVSVFLTYCPFCGTKYEASKAEGEAA
jgi:hypothetical protein